MPEDLTELSASLTGDVLLPSHPDYGQARLCFNLLIDRRPAAIARCRDAGNVASALAFAQDRGLEIAVRGGGHNPAGHCAVDGGLVIDLSRMRHVDVDPATRLATPRAERHGSTSTPRPRRTGWSRPEAWSAQRASRALRSGAASAI